MILDKSLDSNIRFAKNVKYFNSLIAKKSDKESLIKSKKILEDVLGQLLKIKISEYSQTIAIPDLDFESKINLCYKVEIFKNGLRDSLNTFNRLVKYFVNGSLTYEHDEVLIEVVELCNLNDNEIFNLLLKLISKDEKINQNFTKLEELAAIIGVSGLTRFISSIICASLIEVLVEIKE